MTEERPLSRVLNPFDPARAWLLGLLITVLLIGQFSDLGDFMGTVPGLAVALFIAVRRRVSVRDTFRLRPFRPADLAFPVCLSLSLGSAETLVLEAIDFATRGRFGQWAESISPEIPGGTLVTMLLTVVFVPVVEELFFRGFFMSSFAELGMGWAVVFPSIFFATGHSPLIWPGAFAGGVASSLFVLETGSIAPGIAFHAAMNLLGTGLGLVHEVLPGAYGEICCLAMRIGFASMALLFVPRYKRLWISFRMYWADFRGGPGVGHRLKYLLRHWTYKLILVLLAAIVGVWAFLMVTGQPLTAG